MDRTFDERLVRVMARRNPWQSVGANFSNKIALANARVFDAAEKSTSSVERMIYYAMLPVDEDCVKKSKEAGERVKDHLRSRFSTLGVKMPTFEYQGSVVANTQIKGASDIDLLVINEQSYGWDASEIKGRWSWASEQTPVPWYGHKLKDIIDTPDYQGNAIADIKQQREVCETCLRSAYDQCNINKGKSIQLLNKSLGQKVDVVNCIWYDNVRSVVNDKKLPYRGIQIYDKAKGGWMSGDYPFYKIALIDKRNTETNEHYKELIRLVKTLKEDVGGCEALSSFDIYSILYELGAAQYAQQSGRGLVFVLADYFKVLAQNRNLADDIKKLDCEEYVFRGDDKKFKAFQSVCEDLTSVCEALENVKHTAYVFR